MPDEKPADWINDAACHDRMCSYRAEIATGFYVEATELAALKRRCLRLEMAVVHAARAFQKYADTHKLMGKVAKYRTNQALADAMLEAIRP